MFVYQSARAITQDEACTLQEDAGFSPDGYGFPISLINTKKGDAWESRWWCWASCD